MILKINPYYQQDGLGLCLNVKKWLPYLVCKETACSVVSVTRTIAERHSQRSHNDTNIEEIT